MSVWKKRKETLRCPDLSCLVCICDRCAEKLDTNIINEIKDYHESNNSEQDDNESQNSNELQDDNESCSSSLITPYREDMFETDETGFGRKL